MCRPKHILTAVLHLQIVPAESNGVDAINFRTMRDSKSLDFDTHGVRVVPQQRFGGGSANLALILGYYSCSCG